MKVKFDENLHRAILFSYKPLTERYKYKNIFQILPPNKGWKQPKYLLGEHPFVIEYDNSYIRPFLKETEREKDINPEFLKNVDAKGRREWAFLKELYAALTVFTAHYFFENNKYSQNRRQLGKRYFYHNFQNTNKPEIERLDLVDSFEKARLLGEKIYFPDSIDHLFDKYFSLKDEALDVLRISILLIYKSYEIRSISPSLSLVSLISSIENIVNFEGKDIKFPHCPECNKVRSSLSKRFNDFVIKYSYTTDTKMMKKNAEFIYKLRSKIAHAGQLLYYDYASADIDYFCDVQLPKIRRLISICFMNWMLACEP